MPGRFKNRQISARTRAKGGNLKNLLIVQVSLWGQFEDSKTLSYAILLVSKDALHAGYRFVVFSLKAGQLTYQSRLVGKLDQNGAANYFIHRTPISKFFDEPSRKKFQAHRKDGILVVDAAGNEYAVEVYFWAGSQYRHEPVDY